MKLNNCEVNINNVGAWSLDDLTSFYFELERKIDKAKKSDDVSNEKLLLKLINLEIERKTKIKNVDLSYTKKVERVMKDAEKSGFENRS